MYAKYLIVTVNEDGEHEIIFVTSDRESLIKRISAYSGRYKIYEKMIEEYRDTLTRLINETTATNPAGFVKGLAGFLKGK